MGLLTLPNPIAGPKPAFSQVHGDPRAYKVQSEIEYLLSGRDLGVGLGGEQIVYPLHTISSHFVAPFSEQHVVPSDVNYPQPDASSEEQLADTFLEDKLPGTSGPAAEVQDPLGVPTDDDLPGLDELMMLFSGEEVPELAQPFSDDPLQVPECTSASPGNGGMDLDELLCPLEPKKPCYSADTLDDGPLPSEELSYFNFMPPGAPMHTSNDMILPPLATPTTSGMLEQKQPSYASDPGPSTPSSLDVSPQPPPVTQAPSSDEDVMIKLTVPNRPNLSVTLDRDKLLAMPVDGFNHLLDRSALPEADIAYMKEWRRKGKNKMAAQLARKRKREEVEQLSEDLTMLKKEMASLKAERDSLRVESERYASECGRLERKILQAHQNRSCSSKPTTANSHQVLVLSDTVFVVPTGHHT